MSLDNGKTISRESLLKARALIEQYPASFEKLVTDLGIWEEIGEEKTALARVRLQEMELALIEGCYGEE